MYAIVESGSKQFKVKPGDVLDMETLPGAINQKAELSHVLLVADEQKVTVGNPYVPNAKVVGTILGQGRGKKIIVFKYKSTKSYARIRGHRQNYTRLKIDEILL